MADLSPFVKVGNILDLVPGVMVKKFRSDGGEEYMGHEFKQLLLKHSIKHEQSAPYSPHQNGIAERGWRTLFEMGRCFLIGSGLPKVLWPYAMMTATHIRNRCYQNRNKQTQFFMLTGRKPNVGNMHVFGSVCYSLEQNKTKLDPCCKKGIFIGYDKESPAYLIYYADTKKIMRCRCVKFVDTQNILDNEGNTMKTFWNVFLHSSPSSITSVTDKISTPLLNNVLVQSTSTQRSVSSSISPDIMLPFSRRGVTISLTIFSRRGVTISLTIFSRRGVTISLTIFSRRGVTISLTIFSRRGVTISLTIFSRRGVTISLQYFHVEE